MVDLTWNYPLLCETVNEVIKLLLIWVLNNPNLELRFYKKNHTTYKISRNNVYSH